MTQDHYAVLGVAPTAQATVIRAAYLALMRQYHPDRNPSPAAAQQAQAIIAAFKVLGDFERRSEYDWDRRRAREAAEAAASPKRRRPGAGVAAAAIGLAVVTALVLTPSPTPSPPAPPPSSPPSSPRVAAPVKARNAPARKVAPRSSPVREPPVAVAAPPPAPVKAKMAEPVRAARTEPARVIQAEPVRIARPEPARREQRALERPTRAIFAAARPPARPAAKPAPPARDVATNADLAALDQFVMAFYGQSWRYGDAPRRAVLEQTRAGFVVRRGACAADACKRAAYLKLMRDVSDIVEGGAAKPR